MTRRRAAGLATAGLVALAVLTGCGPSPAPVPTPTPTGFADEEAAFAAAEATYRAYVDALNRVDLSDPDTFEDVYKWTTGDLNTTDRQTYSTWHAEGYTVNGDASILQLTRLAFDEESGGTILHSCFDVSRVDVIDPGGASLVSSDRPDVQALEIVTQFDRSSETRALIAAINPAQESDSCGQ